MPRFHRVETFDGQGNLMDLVETPYTVEEEDEADDEDEGTDLFDKAKQAYENWASLTATQKDRVLRELLRLVALHLKRHR